MSRYLINFELNRESLRIISPPGGTVDGSREFSAGKVYDWLKVNNNIQSLYTRLLNETFSCIYFIQNDVINFWGTFKTSNAT